MLELNEAAYLLGYEDAGDRFRHLQRVLLALNNAGAGDEKQLTTADLDIPDFEGSGQGRSPVAVSLYGRLKKAYLRLSFSGRRNISSSSASLRARMVRPLT